MMEPLWLDSHDICVIHGEILAESGGDFWSLRQGWSGIYLKQAQKSLSLWR